MASPSIGFIIISHHFDENKPQILRLLKKLNEFSNSHTIIHHDFSKTDFPEKYLAEFRASFVRPHVVTSWATWPVVLATLDAMRLLLEKKPDVEYFIILSANDYPIKSVNYIENFFRNSTVDGYIQQYKIDYEAFKRHIGQSHYVKYSYLDLFRLKIKVPFISKKGKFYFRKIYLPKPGFLLPFNENFQCFIGEQWFMGNKKMLDFFVKIKHEETSFGKYASLNKICPDNLFFHTLIGNNRQFNVSTDMHRFTDWKNSTNHHPNVLTMEHKDEVFCSNALFARKFDYTASDQLIKTIEHQFLEERKSS